MMDILNWGVTTEWVNDNLTLLFFAWLIVGVIGAAMIKRHYGSEGGEIFFLWFLWLFFGWAVVIYIFAFPVLSVLIVAAICIGYFVCSKLYVLIVNYGKGKNDRTN